MISAKLPPDENQRLQALYNYEILDTEAEDVFDDLTLLASEICGTPIALISLIDPNRQWFKSTVGIDAQETSRDIAFCAHAINQRKIFEVKDTLKDERFFDNPLVTDNPNIRFYAGSPLVTPKGHAIGTLCAISDKPMELNEHQRNALAILGREVVSQLELRSKIQQIKQSNQQKTDFLSMVSHELRTPLNAIISFSHLMLNDKEVSLSKKHKNYLNHIDFSCNRLMALVNSVLDLHKIEAGKIEVKYSNVNGVEFFESLQGLIFPLADKKNISLEFTSNILPESTLHVDETKLAQIVINILSNAVKFSSAGQKVEMKVFHLPDELTIIFKDYGVGISEQDMPKIFNKFQQVGEFRNKEGSGLGLMITKNLVELMGGKLQLNSSVDNGTLVKVSLPLVLAEEELAPAQSVNLNINVAGTVLVVEDNEINREVAKAIFASLGMTIELVETGEEAIEVIKKGKFDLIFMDLNLPGMDGYQTTKEIKQRYPEQVVVALTADVFADKDKRMIDSGLCEVLHKPINMQRLIAILNKFLTVKK